MINKIHIFGASGSGTTTLGEALSSKLGIQHFDTDNYFWRHTTPPFQLKTEVEERVALLSRDLHSYDKWILTGSLCGWGDVFIPEFDLAIFIYTPKELRMSRIVERERKRFGDKIDKDGSMHASHIEFIDWASRYDDGDLNIRSKALHEAWIKKLRSRVLRLEGDMTIDQRVDAVIKEIYYEHLT
jgi:adenylate kinase family enzyme